MELVHIRNCWRKTVIVRAEWTAKEPKPVPRLEQLYKKLESLIRRIQPSQIEQLSVEAFGNGVPGENEREPMLSERNSQTDSTEFDELIRSREDLPLFNSLM